MQQDNKNIAEFGLATQGNLTPTEQNVFAQNPTFEERLSNEQMLKKPKPTPKQQTDLKKVMSLLVATTATVTLGVGVVQPVKEAVSPIETAEVRLVSFGVDGDEVYYTLEYQSETPLDVVLYNDFTNRRNDLDEQSLSGSFDNLKAGMTYTFAVVGDGLLTEKEVYSRKVTVPDPAKDVTATFTSYGANGRSVYFNLQATGNQPLTVVLQNQDTYLTQQFVANGDAENTDGQDISTMAGTFDKLELDTSYTLSVVCDGIVGSRVETTVTVQTPPPMKGVATFVEYGVEGRKVFFQLEATAHLPMTVKLYNDTESYELPFESQEVAEGLATMSGEFANLSLDTTYTLAVVLHDYDGDVEIATMQIQTPAPMVDTAQATILEQGADGRNVFFHIQATQDLPITVVLYNDAERYELPFEAQEVAEGLATMTGEFANLNLDTTYTLAVVLHDYDGDVEITAMQIQTPAPMVDTAQATFVEGGANGNSAFFHLKATADAPMTVVLYNDTESYELPFEAQELTEDNLAIMTGEFANLNLDTTYTLAVVLHDYDGDVEITAMQIQTPAPMVAEAQILENNMDATSVYFHIQATADMPLSVVLYNDTTNQTLPFEDNAGRDAMSLPEGADVSLAQMSGNFDNLEYGQTYTLAVVLADYDGDREITSATIVMPHPVEVADATITEHTVMDISIAFTTQVNTDLPLEILLEGEGVSLRQELPTGTYSGTFDNVDTTLYYTMSIVGQGYDGDVVIDFVEINSPTA